MVDSQILGSHDVMIREEEMCSLIKLFTKPRALWLCLALACAQPAIAQSAATSTACQAADVLFGKVELQIVPEPGWESALVRHADFNDNSRGFGVIRGEITVDRGGFAIRNRDNQVVGVISPKLQVEGWDDDCDKNAKIIIRKLQPEVYVIMNGDTPVGTIKGRFPKNGFGVR
jgi:hypothetical protein